MTDIEFPVGDYVSPGFLRVRPDASFPNLTIGDTSACSWKYLRRTGNHNWYCDRRKPNVGFANRDEAHILYNTARLFQGKEALEIGCFMGWSACHLALGGVALDVIDPLLADSSYFESVSSSINKAGVPTPVRLYTGSSPDAVVELVRRTNKRWSLMFIDGNHDFPGPVNDAVVCERYCAPDAMVLFHDLLSPHVAEGLQYFRYRGWKTRIFHTSQIMGVAWRGNVQPVHHIPDPAANWEIPAHLLGWPEAQLEWEHDRNATGQSDDPNGVAQVDLTNADQTTIKLFRNSGIWSVDEARTGHYIDESLADAIIREFPIAPESVADLGCGLGQYCRHFTNRAGWNVQGYEGLAEAKDMGIYERIEQVDLSQPQHKIPEYELVLCLEVGEHIPKQFEANFLDNVTSIAKKNLILSWAIPGQGGTGHFNERENPYVVQQIEEHGFRFNPERTARLRKAATLWWFEATLMAFERVT